MNRWLLLVQLLLRPPLDKLAVKLVLVPLVVSLPR
jgi:hypothetical protein